LVSATTQSPVGDSFSKKDTPGYKILGGFHVGDGPRSFGLRRASAVDVAAYITGYTSADEARIRFDWNGKHAEGLLHLTRRARCDFVGDWYLIPAAS
jgi:hypothetical protein